MYLQNHKVFSVRFAIGVLFVFSMAVHAPAAATLSDLWNGHATWVKDTDQIGREFHFHYLSIVQDNRDLFAFYVNNYTTADGKFKMTVGRAHGGDGVHWINDGRVLDVGGPGPTANRIAPAWDDRLTSFPGAWKDGDTWYLVYEGAGENVAGDIGLATSTDGKTFLKYPKNPILRHNPDGWERANIGTPSLLKKNGTWYLFYHGYDFNVCQIGVASGKSLTELTKSTANPILPVTPGDKAWDSGTTGKRSSIIREGKYYYFAYEGSTLQPFSQSKWSSGMARSTNLLSGWTKFPGNPMIPQTAGGFGNDGPELLRLSDTWYLYVRSAGSNQTERYRLANEKTNP